MTVRNPLWHVDAACLRSDPKVFYPMDLGAGNSGVAAAKRICASCPVCGECLADVMAAEDPARRRGISGGTTPTERTALFDARQALRTAAAAGEAA